MAQYSAEASSGAAARRRRHDGGDRDREPGGEERLGGGRRQTDDETARGEEMGQAQHADHDAQRAREEREAARGALLSWRETRP